MLELAVMVAQFPSTGEHYGLLFHQGNPLVTCVNKAIATLKANGTLPRCSRSTCRSTSASRPSSPEPARGADRHDERPDQRPASFAPSADPVGAAATGLRRASPFARTGRGARLRRRRPQAVRSSRPSAPSSCSGPWRRSSWLAPGARAVEHAFFSPQHMWQSFIGNPKQGYYSVGAGDMAQHPDVPGRRGAHPRLALLIALIRQSVSPVLFPFRVLAMIYVDFFRGVPLMLVVYAVGLGVPALQLPVISHQSSAVYGVAVLTLSYSAYVSEVYRAGLNSRAPEPGGRGAVARPLEDHALRYVILPQAVRNIIPPLLNDFISLQKDTALVGVLGAIEANQAADIYASRCSTSPASRWPPSCS